MKTRFRDILRKQSIRELYFNQSAKNNVLSTPLQHSNGALENKCLSLRIIHAYSMLNS